MNTPTSNASWSGRIRVVGDLERPDHSCLKKEHVCCFFDEYTARKGYAHSSTNSLIFNLKKNPTRRGTEEWKYKLCAIETAACLIRPQLETRAFVELHLRSSPAFQVSTSSGVRRSESPNNP